MKAKMYLLFLVKLITTNPVKTAMLVISLITINHLNCIPDRKKEYQIETELKIKGETFYVATIDGDTSLLEEDEAKKSGEKLIQTEFNDLNILIWVAFILSSLFVTIPIISREMREDSDVSWDTEYVWKKTVECFITCEIEDGKYLYYVGDYLVFETKQSEYSNYVADMATRSKLNAYPKVKSKRVTRSEKLQELGV